MKVNRGTFSGDNAEIDFVKRFNSDKINIDFHLYLKNCDIKSINDIYMVRVKTKQYSKLSNHVVMTRADTYLIESYDRAIKQVLLNNDSYLDEDILHNYQLCYRKIKHSGISVKMTDSDNFQILKLTPESFKNLFGNYELGAGASVYCLNKEEIYKNEDVYIGWKTTKENIIEKFKKDLPIVEKLNEDIKADEKTEIFKLLKEFSINKIKQLVNQNKMLQEIIFNGYHIYDEPYSATYFYHGGTIIKLDYIPFTVTTGSGRSKGIYTIVFKPKNETKV